MKAILCQTLDGPDALVLADIGDPQVHVGDVIIAVKAIGLNFFDTLITAGKYQTKPQLPFSPGGEVAGVVESVGPGVSGLQPGDRVMAYVGYGGAREKVAVSSEYVVKLPDLVSFEVASSLSITYGTAIHGLRERAEVKAGETVAILGAAGGAGLAAVEITKLLGARVIAAASTADKLAICQAHGADETVLTQSLSATAFKDALKAASHGRGVDVVYDCVGGDLAEPAFRALAWQGRYLVIGFASGNIPKLPLNLLLVKGVSAVGVYWGEAVRRNPACFRADMALVLDAVRDGRLKPTVHAVLPFAEVRAALSILERREAIGKVVLSIS